MESENSDSFEHKAEGIKDDAPLWDSSEDEGDNIASASVGSSHSNDELANDVGELQDDEEEETKHVRKKPRLVKKKNVDLDDDEIEQIAFDEPPAWKRGKEVDTEEPRETEDDNFIDRNNYEQDEPSVSNGDEQIDMDVEGAQGLSYEQIQEAREIFGELEEFDEEDELLDVDEEGEKLAAPVGSNQGPSVDYIGLMQSFSLEEDEEIRAKDVPERYFVGNRLWQRNPVDDTFREEEAEWIAQQLMSSENSNHYSVGTSNIANMKALVKKILEFIQVDKLEIPVVWLYKRDYFSETISRRQLWKIYWLDGRWCNLYSLRESLVKRLEKLKAVYDLDVVSPNLKLFPLEYYANWLRSQTDEESVRDLVTYIRLMDCTIPDLVDAGEGGENCSQPQKGNLQRKNEYARYKGIARLREFVELLCHPAHELGKALRTGYHLDPPHVANVNPDDFIGNFIATSQDGRFKNAQQFLRASLVVIATEISLEPSVRQTSRTFMKDQGYLSTKPTMKGLNAITPFSEYFGIHFIERKPLYQLFERDGLQLFARIIDAEQKGLIEVEINVTDLGKHLQLMQLILPAQHHSHPRDQVWNVIRLKLVETVVEEFLLPSLKASMRSALLRLSRERIIEEICDGLESKLEFGPYYEYDPAEKREFVATLLRSCPKRLRYETVVGVYVSTEHPYPVDCVCVDRDGVVISYLPIVSMNLGSWEEKIKLFLYEYRPDCIVINTGGLERSRRAQMIIEKAIKEIDETIKLELKRKQDDEIEQDERSFKFTPKVAIVSDDLANIFKKSTRCKELFSRQLADASALPTNGAAAVSLARYAQEPLLEYCGMWKAMDSSLTFGFEALFLNLHPFQHLVTRFKKRIIQRLECVLVDAVSDVGVDIYRAARNPHYAILLAFVPGLGLRKADKLIRNLAGTTSIDGRLSLKKFWGDCVWNNASSFIRFNGEQFQHYIDPLEDTRIHPECYLIYDFAIQMCADAMDVERDPSKDSKVVADLMVEVRKSLEKRIKKHPEWIDQFILGSSHTLAPLLNDEKRIELNDCLSHLELDSYSAQLAEQNKGNRRIELEMIKEELRFPWLDLRIPMPNLAAQMTKIISNETQYSLHLGMKVGFTVTEILNDGIVNNQTQQVMSRGKAKIITDTGLRGVIFENEIEDNSSGKHIDELISVGYHGLGVVIGISYEKMTVELSTRPQIMKKSEADWLEERCNNGDKKSQRYWEYQQNVYGRNPHKLFDRYFDEKEALNSYKAIEESTFQHAQNADYRKETIEKSRIEDKSHRVASGATFHPLFKNLNFKDAEDKLRNEGRGAGAVVIRPSSKGPNYLTITWAFKENGFKHISVLDRGKLEVQDDSATNCEPYNDMDELLARYIDPMNDFVSAMVKHKSFHSGSTLEVEQTMHNQLRDSPGRIPYFIRFEEGKPGWFILTWLATTLDGSHHIKTMKILVTPQGYRVNKEKVFPRPTELIQWFKKLNEQPAAVQAKPQRRSRFDRA